MNRPLPRTDEPIDLFVQNIELAHIAGVIHQRLYSPQAVAELSKAPVPEILNKAVDILQKLDAWKAGLPAQYHVSKTAKLPDEVIKLYLNYYNLVTCVHRSHADIVCCAEDCVVEPARAMMRLVRDTGFVVNSACW